MKIPKCKCGAKLFLRNGLPINKLCVKCRKEKDLIKKEIHKLTKSFQKTEYQRLHNRAWRLMSIKIRTTGMDKNGINTCYTCGIKKHFKELQAGHFFHDKLDFDERNLKPQCQQCNKYLSGNLSIYALNLIKDNGQEWFEQLHKDANRTIYKSSDLIKIIEKLSKLNLVLFLL